MKWERDCRNCANLVIVPLVEVGRGEHCYEK